MLDVPDSGLPYLTIFIVYSVWFFLFEGWIWYRRNKQPLKARGVVWLTLVDISGYLFLSSICWKEIVGNENFSCAIKALVNNICPPIFFFWVISLEFGNCILCFKFKIMIPVN